MDREQPTQLVSGTVSAEKENNNIAVESIIGSQKFKDVQSLETAYQNLHSEFTRKCQRLSELEKENLAKHTQEVKPIYERESWSEDVDVFLQNNSDAKNYATEIIDELIKDKDLAAMPNSLELAYSKVIASKYKSQEELMADPDYLQNYVLNNPSIKQAVIDNYINELQTKQSPQLINSKHTASVGVTPNKKISSLQEAAEMAKKLFNK